MSDQLTSNKRSRNERSGSELVRWCGLLGVVTVLLVAMGQGAALSAFVDIPSLVFVLGIVIGGVWWSFGPRAALQVFSPAIPASVRSNMSAARRFVLARRRARSLAFGAGVFGLLIGFVTMLATLGDPAQMGPSLAVALLCPFYASILAWLCFSGRPRNIAA